MRAMGLGGSETLGALRGRPLLAPPPQSPPPRLMPPPAAPSDPAVCVAGVWCSPEQVAAGQEARVRVPFPVRRVPVLLHHDGVQCVHVCELAHVRGPLTRPAARRALVLLFCAIQDPAAPRVTRAPSGPGPPALPRWSQASAPASVAQAVPPLPAPSPPPWVPPAHPFLSPPCEDSDIRVNFQAPFLNSD